MAQTRYCFYLETYLCLCFPSGDIPNIQIFLYIHFTFAESVFATLPRTARGVPIVLGGDPKGKNFLYTNGNSVIIRDIEVSELFSSY